VSPCSGTNTVGRGIGNAPIHGTSSALIAVVEGRLLGFGPIWDMLRGLGMKHRNSHLLVGYWNRLRTGRDVPDQTDIDPRAIKRLLCTIFILDAVDPFRPVYRLAGTALCDHYGAELKGTNYLARWEGLSRDRLTSALQQSLALRQPLCVSSIAASSECGMVELESVLAPIRFGSGAPSRFIGMMQIIGSENTLGGRPITFERFVSSRIVAENDRGSPLDHPPPPAPQLKSIEKRAPHLRLIISREKPPAWHIEHEAMARVIKALEITPSRPNLAS